MLGRVHVAMKLALAPRSAVATLWQFPHTLQCPSLFWNELTPCLWRRRVWPSKSFQTTAPVCGRRSAKIALRKGKGEAIRSKLYGRMGKLIIQAVRLAGPDPVANTKLRDLLAQARLSNVPKDILDRNIKKASAPNQEDFVEMVYEAYGPGGTGFILDCLTDNVNRTAAEVRQAVTKGGWGKMADGGSVLFNFRRQGLVRVGPDCDEDELFEAATDAGAEDLQAAEAEEEDGSPTGFNVYTDVVDYMSVYRALETAQFPVDGEVSGLVYVPMAPLECDDDIYTQNSDLYERILAVDDVDSVYSSCDGLH